MILPQNKLKPLLSHYLSCIEEEDLRNLSFRKSDVGTRFITPFRDQEEIFFQGTGIQTIGPLHPDEISYLKSGRLQAGNRDTLYYGYPLFLNEKGYISPLFFAEVEIELGENANLIITQEQPEAVLVNQYLFRGQRFTAEELLLIQEELEKPFGSFHARLKTALDYLDLEETFMPDHLESRLLHNIEESRWLNMPILFRSAFGPYTYNLRKDLQAFVSYDFLLNDVPKTAFGFLMQPEPRVTTTSHEIAEVLPLNEAQHEAANAALSRNLTVVTGPPGTGKSQVVVDLLASSILSGQSVLFASKNNKAVDVVRERLRHLLGRDRDFVLRLGNRDAIEMAHQEIDNALEQLQINFTGDEREACIARQNGLKVSIATCRKTLDTLYKARADYQNKKKTRQELEAVLTKSWVSASSEDQPFNLSLPELNRVLGEAKALAGQTRLGLILWIKRLFLGQKLRDRVCDWIETMLQQVPDVIAEDVQVEIHGDTGYDSIVRMLEQLLVYWKWKKAQKDEESALNTLKSLFGDAADYDERVSQLKRELADYYQTLCRDTWAIALTRSGADARIRLRSYFRAAEGMYRGSRSDFRANLDRCETTEKNLATLLPIWIVTNLSVRNAFPLRPNLFDLVVIDEASQCDIASAIPLLFRARRAVIIGDPKQLRHISTINEKEEPKLARKSGAGDLLGDWSYVKRSLYDVAEAAVDEPFFLNEHYRSHPEIIGFSNQTFYNNRLQIRTSSEQFSTRFDPFRTGLYWHQVSGSVPPTTRSAYNPEEIRQVLQFFHEWRNDGILKQPEVSFGVVTPFRAQADRIERALLGLDWWKEIEGTVTVGTAHTFQGNECDIMVFSPVVSPGIRDRTRDWVTRTDQLLNVALTRARATLIIAGNRQACQEAGGRLFELCQYIDP